MLPWWEWDITIPLWFIICGTCTVMKSNWTCWSHHLHHHLVACFADVPSDCPWMLDASSFCCPSESGQTCDWTKHWQQMWHPWDIGHAQGKIGWPSLWQGCCTLADHCWPEVDKLGSAAKLLCPPCWSFHRQWLSCFSSWMDPMPVQAT